ncbi:transcription factor GTE6 [Striga asiatica]|uniref:Transcription factor GTE6 n=1 Tax=Striga asiatica TaxID=4170 RepID=A0A5A7PAA1_STRAF|nr:transcription factor GTE6 [Striga asiatica]
MPPPSASASAVRLCLRRPPLSPPSTSSSAVRLCFRSQKFRVGFFFLKFLFISRINDDDDDAFHNILSLNATMFSAEFVMSTNSKNPTSSSVDNRVGPDFFGFFTTQVVELLSRDEGKDEVPLPLSHSISHLANEVREGKRSTKNSKSKENNCAIGSESLFDNGVGALLSDSKRESLKSLLRQSVFTLTKEVDEIVDPILSICRIHSCLKCKEHLLCLDASACKVDTQQPHKKLKHGCLIDDDMRILLESDTTKVEELVKKQTNEFSTTVKLHHMEKKLEELLNTLMTSCRPMTLAEKQQLRRSIQNLPPRNLDRVVEIINQNKLPSGKYPFGEVYVDLDGMDNATLWRLHFYVATFQASNK